MHLKSSPFCKLVVQAGTLKRKFERMCVCVCVVVLVLVVVGSAGTLTHCTRKYKNLIL